jgi:Ca-activated chloride channel homolog
MRRRSKKVWVSEIAVGILLPCLGVTSGWARAAGTQQPGAAQPQGTVRVDKDPVGSPDPDPPPGAASSTETELGRIEREKGRYTLRTDAYEVRLNATVLDGSGKSIQTLDKDAFRVYEDGVVQTITSFRHEDLPVSLGILIDSSGSMYDKRTAVQAASLDLIKLSNPADEAFVVDFSWEAYIDADFTNDINKLKDGLGFIKSSGGTAIYDALVASADYLTKNAKRPKQVLLIITDGEDNASSATLEQAIRRIQDLDGPVIYCVGLLFGGDTDRGEARHARRVLEALSEQTGGVAYFPKSVNQVDEIAAEVAQDIRTQYTISYHSTKSPTLGGYRQVHVEAKGKNMGRLSVRTRTGYFPKVNAAANKSGEGGGAPALTGAGKQSN